MIIPDDIRRKTANLYPSFLQAWLKGKPFFPRDIRAEKRLSADNPSAAIAAVTALRAQSKETLGKGYSIHWIERSSRTHGRNLFPQKIVIETEEDFLWLCGKQNEFARFSAATRRLQEEFPELQNWIASHIPKLIEVADRVDGLMSVLSYFKANPRPNMFPRELPIAVPTKFILENQSILREWFDSVLPPETINAGEQQFERRYGLKLAQQHLFLRILDDALYSELGVPFEELSLPVDTLARLPVSGVQVFIVENKTNALTMPLMPRSLVLGGLGDGVVILHRLPWLSKCKIVYWGDADTEGFEALSALRSFASHATSIFMDSSTLSILAEHLGKGTGTKQPFPLLLHPEERDAFDRCASENLRLEQERIPHKTVVQLLSTCVN